MFGVCCVFICCICVAGVCFVLIGLSCSSVCVASFVFGLLLVVC